MARQGLSDPDQDEKETMFLSLAPRNAGCEENQPINFGMTERDWLARRKGVVHGRGTGAPLLLLQGARVAERGSEGLLRQ